MAAPKPQERIGTDNGTMNGVEVRPFGTRVGGSVPCSGPSLDMDTGGNVPRPSPMFVGSGQPLVLGSCRRQAARARFSGWFSNRVSQ